MRRCLLSLSVLLALVAAMAPAGATSALPEAAATAQLNPGGANFSSDNLEYITTLPIDAPGVGARVVQVGEQRRLYVTGVQSLTIYDVTTPASPTILGRLQLPNWENEDVAVSADGKTVLISEFTGTYLHVITVEDGPNGTLLPLRAGFSPMNNGHIVSCIDTACDWVYGSEGSIIDLRDKTNPIHLEQGWADQLDLSTSGHNIEIINPTTCTYPDDGSVQCPGGIVTADITPITFLDVSNPTAPTIITQTDAQEMDDNSTGYQHNNMVPLAEQYLARSTQTKPGKGKAGARRPRPDKPSKSDGTLRPGELMMSNGETNFSGTCNTGSGPFATYAAKNWSEGAAPRLAHVLRPVSGEYDNGDPAINALGCSGHWFDWKLDADGDYTVAGAWYEHGTRLLKVDSATGAITQIGFYQPVVGSASAAHWIDDEYIYTIDYERGIDILRYDAAADPPSTQEIDASWLAKLNAKSPVAETERFACKLAQDRAGLAALR